MPKRCKLAHAFRREYSDNRLKLARLLGQLGVFLTWGASAGASPPRRPVRAHRGGRRLRLAAGSGDRGHERIQHLEFVPIAVQEIPPTVSDNTQPCLRLG